MGTRQRTGLQESRFWPGEEPAWKNPIGYGPAEKRGCRELFDGQGSPLQAPELSTLTCRKSRKGGRKLAWMRKALLPKVEPEEEGQRRWKVAAFQPQWFCDSVLQSAIGVHVYLSVCGGEGILESPSR